MVSDVTVVGGKWVFHSTKFSANPVLLMIIQWIYCLYNITLPLSVCNTHVVCNVSGSGGKATSHMQMMWGWYFGVPYRWYYNKNKWVSDFFMEIMWIVFRRDISRVHRTNEISLPKTMNMIFTDDQHKFVLVFMPYYYWLDMIFMVYVSNLK